ncbi:lipopolysaccharide export system protein LptA [Orbus hercynius]|uniref:Lipopolysaccharide export system protein LptA n=1 Tax=Orbus hercynius TaxID=593135 RepID=A0A495RF36_9GAMM|nr:lipopolysaccharide transport periplasmic protein LptA [Orbus hercynius]RKS86019.1 lipopolysaccharide export system protein LptA [Orbus hercynius]
MRRHVPSRSTKIKFMLVGLIISLLSSLSHAQTSPSATINNKPISIDADNQQIDLKNNTITFTGNVVIIQDNLEVKAHTVVITDMNSKENQIITANGSPVYFKQMNAQSPKQTIIGHANQLIYQVKENSVTLIGDAELLQQDNHIVSNKIIYDVNQQKILAQANKGSRVKTTIIPNQVQEIKR